MKSVVSRPAQDAFNDILSDLIEEDAIERALELEAALAHAQVQLEEHPRSGRRVGSTTRRLVLLSTYLVTYFVDDDKGLVVITNIRHGARSPLK